MSRTPRLFRRITATTVAPLDGGEVDDPATHKDQQQGCKARKELGTGERELSQNSASRRFGPVPSELDAVVAVAAPDNHGNRKGENGSQGCPTSGDQHGLEFSWWWQFT
jgi:hypothetical protein